jgi:hypothetical protein
MRRSVRLKRSYVQANEIEAGEQLLDRIAAMLHSLGARR